MANPSAPSNRAFLLAGLRTGGVRSVSQPLQAPHTAAPTGSFNIPRFASASHPSNPFPEEDEDVDQLAEMAGQTLNFNYNARNAGIPMTAGITDGVMGAYQQQLLLQQLAAQRAFNGVYSLRGEQSEMQSQMMQMELLKYQALQQQAQQYQAELIAQSQRQQQQQRGNFRAPMTAGPDVTSFDHRVNTAGQLRARAQQAEYRSSMAGMEDFGPVPMTAAIGGKFASRDLNPHANAFVAGHYNEINEDSNSFMTNDFTAGPIPPTPSRTTVISGGTSLGSPPILSKSDAAVSWRRQGNNSVLRSSTSNSNINTTVNRYVPSNDESSPTIKARPQPLKFTAVDTSILPTVSVESVDEDGSSGSTSASNPTTPPSNPATLAGDIKKPYESQGLGKQPGAMANSVIRHVSMPLRQPKGPPSGADELGPRNFATRLRRQAIGGLGALVSARERRETVVEVQAY